MEEVVSLLHTISDSLINKSNNYYFTIAYDSIYEDGKNTAKFTYYFDNPIQLENDKYEMGLLGLDTYYVIPNITSSINGNFRYSTDNQATWKLVTLRTGSYEIKTIDEAISDLVGTVDARFFHIFPDMATLKSRIKLTSAAAAIDFTYPNSINYRLGFNPAIISGLGNHYSDNIVNIQPIDSLNVNVDCISGSYINGKMSTSIFAFFPDVAPGYKIAIDRQTPTFLPFAGSSLNSITVWISDQDGNLANFRGENIITRFYLRRR